jgi:ferredoxin/flavodoxin---NADP+ reductase
MSQKFIEGRVVGRIDHTPTLFSLQFEAAIDSFTAGQFCRVGLPLAADLSGGEDIVMRAYSLVNAPDERPHEILLNKVDSAMGGVLSPYLHELKIGDRLCVSPRTNGFFSMPEVPDADVLWGLSTGTAIGPYLSFMKTEAPWKKFGRIVFVHAVRMAAELTYRDQLAAIARRYGERFQYIPFVSRENHPAAMSGRIPAAIADGSLEVRVGIALTADTAHCMLCGNPEMVTDTMTVLQARGLRKHRPKHPGHITTEAYW